MPGFVKICSTYKNLMIFLHQDCAATIVSDQYSGRRKLVVYGSYSTTVNFKWLDPHGGWTTISASQHNNEWMKSVSVTNYEHYLMGGYTSNHYESYK